MNEVRMVKVTQAPPGFYTASQAARRLGLKMGTFQYQVRTGKIRKYTPPGGAEGYYLRSEIDEIAWAHELFLLRYSTSPKTYERASTEDDIRGIYDLCVTAYGAASTPTFETRLAHWRRDPRMYYVLKQDTIVVGYISFVHFTREAIAYMMSDRKVKREITLDDIIPLTPGQPVDHLFVSLAVRPGLTNEQQRAYGFRL